MILTSYYTGHGHASITNALTSALDETTIEYCVVEMVDMCGFFLKKRCKSYGKTTTKRPWLWSIYYKLSHKFYKKTNWMVRRSCQKKFITELYKFKPDVIVSVHPMFVGSIIDILRKNNYKPKFATVIADLVSINNLWLDPRANLIFFPTHESIALAKNKGIVDYQIQKSTLPSRSLVNKKAQTINIDIDKTKPYVKCLVMSGGEGSGNIEETIDNILINQHTTVHAILGRNKKLYNRLSPKYKENNRVTIDGFVSNIQDIMPTCDIAIVRGSPNVLMECINMLVPIITTDCLPGQEQGNDYWVYKNGFGLMCKDKKKLPETIAKYLENDRELLKQTRINQYQYRDLNAAQKTIQIILDKFEKNNHI